MGTPGDYIQHSLDYLNQQIDACTAEERENLAGQLAKDGWLLKKDTFYKKAATSSVSINLARQPAKICKYSAPIRISNFSFKVAERHISEINASLGQVFGPEFLQGLNGRL